MKLTKCRRFLWRLAAHREQRVMSYAEKRLLGYSSAQIFDVVNTVVEYPQFVPWCKTVKTRKFTERAAEYDLSIGFPPLMEHYTSRVTSIYPYAIRSLCKDGRLFYLLDTMWRFGPSPPGFDPSCSCMLHYSLTFEFKSAFHAQLSHIFFAQIVRKMVFAFLTRAESIYGPPSICSTQSMPEILSYQN